jgi:acetylornithine deacetylase/succinyl-diaminopimelate desuccinylase-like protein
MAEGLWEAADRALAARREEGLAGLAAFLSIPSVSALPAHAGDVRRAAGFLAEAFREAGATEVAVWETGGHPAVYAAWLGAPGRPTALVYGHYDVQPPDPEDRWTSPPFQPTVRGGRLYARGASDDKGQVWMHVEVLRALVRAAGGPPLNLKFLVEGEEEVGSRSLPALVARERERLRADAVVISDSAFLAPGVPALPHGLRGLALLEVTVRGAHRDLHSGEYGGAVPNPLHVLAELVAGLHDRTGRVAVPGFYDDVRPPTPAEREVLARLPVDFEAALRGLGVPASYGEPGYTALERTTLRPTLEVNGLWGGFTGEGSKTVIPSEAHAKISCRLVPDQDPARVLACVRDDLFRRCPRHVELEVRLGGGHPATVVPPDAPVLAAASRALERAFGRPAVVTRMGGSIGVVPALTQELGAPVAFVGFGLPEDAIHAPDESFDLGQYERGMRALVALWEELARG